MVIRPVKGMTSPRRRSNAIRAAVAKTAECPADLVMMRLSSAMAAVSAC
jgi:hypothetical protein